MNEELVPSAGTCGVMGTGTRAYFTHGGGGGGGKGDSYTASTMAIITEALGMAPLGTACAPANSSARLRIAELIGTLAADTLPKPSEILTMESFENAITVLQAIGGSTNAIVHVLAIAGRVKGLNLTLSGQSAGPVHDRPF